MSPLADKAFHKVLNKILICYPSEPLMQALGKKSPVWARHILEWEGSQSWFNGLLDSRCVLVARVRTTGNEEPGEYLQSLASDVELKGTEFTSHSTS